LSGTDTILPADRIVEQFGLAPGAARLKRTFDICAASVILIAVSWIVLALIIVSRIDTGHGGLFRQQRVGLFGRPFTHLKIRTMRPVSGLTSTVTRKSDPRVTRLGSILRRTRLDELPQLVNVIRGDMSLVGPRPDVPEMYENLSHEDLRVLSVRPGMTGPATLAFRDEEGLLSGRDDIEAFNRTVLFREKVRMNLEYIDNYRFSTDIRILVQTAMTCCKVAE